MSLTEIIQQSINDAITKYITTISNKFSIDKNELLKIWNNDTVDKNKPIYDDTKQKIVNSLSKLTKPELIELCKTKGLKTKGTKSELIETLSNDENKKLTVKSSDKITTKLIAKIPSISIKRNKFDNFEHEETSFVFDNKEKKVYGKQNPDGSVSPLTKEDINLCNKYKFLFVTPDNLESKNSVKNEDDLEDIDDEINDEEEDEEDELEEIEEEEEFEEEFEE